MTNRILKLALCGAIFGTWVTPMMAGAANLTKAEAQEIAREAYIYAYPLVLSDVTRQTSTNVEVPSGSTAPVNQLSHMREFPDENFTVVVRPNADTLYTVLTYDVRKEPLVFSVPASEGRYFLLPWLDYWSNVFTVPGTRTTGNEAQKFAIVGPSWVGEIPKGVREYRSPTGSGLLIGRTQTNGKSDYKAVHAFQDGMSAVPLSAYGKPYTPPKGVVRKNQNMEAPPDQVDQMSADVFFTLFAELMKDNAPNAYDAPIIDRMARLGIEPGSSFNFSQAPAVVRDALNAAPEAASKQIKTIFQNSGELINGWRAHKTAIGTYGTDYLHRAGVAYAGYGANVVEDAIYPTINVDASGKPLSSNKKYVLHFEKDEIPPVNAFWSLTMYDERQLFTANPIKRYAIGDRDKIAFNKDGSLDIYIQREAPGDGKESNWLPAPAKGEFSLMLRLYSPKAQVMESAWSIPPVKHVDH